MFSASAPQGPPKEPCARPMRRSVGSMAADEARKTPRDAPDDLLHLEDFNDTELLRGLWMRYERKEIYTWVGSVLVSVNPYRDIQAFSEDRMIRYASNNPPQAPHLFATVRAALTAAGERHALLITGESGAGKTEATRAVLSFLAMRGAAPSLTDAGPTDYVRDRLLRSTPVLEAFGNAHTRQNTNSSRFGKFIEVQLSHNLEVVGATLQPYMLEASRVAGDLPVGERTYHIFYLLRATLSAVASGTTPEGPFWTHLAHAPEWAELVSLGGAALVASTRLENGPATDLCLERFEALHEGLIKVGLNHSEVANCCRIVAAVSLLADTDAGESVLSVAASLLQIPEEQLRNFLEKVETSVGSQKRERFQRTRSDREALTLRASFAQELYASLFGWLTRLVARGIAPPSEDLNGGRALGLLDLYGFEVFPSNGFEQFLINYCNERLQQFFNQQVFTKEAEEYSAEGLDSDGQWSRLVRACQLPALALLEGEGGAGSVGAFGVINDRSRCGFEDTKQDGGSALAQAIALSCGQHPAYRHAARDSSRVFGIAHFAGEVFYEAAQFQRKNASAHRPDIAAFLREHGDAFVREVVCSPESENRDGAVRQGSTATPAAASASRRKLFGRTLISSFREELNELCTALEARECRHVRCLRPNDDQAPLVFDDASMLRQCRYSGLLEATRIRRQGYAHRRPVRTFAARFALLLGTREARAHIRCHIGHMPAANAAVACNAICQAAASAGISSDDATIGNTKVFLRENALLWFESARRRVAGGIILALLRGHHTRQCLNRLHNAALSVQSVMRGRRARAFVQCLRAEMRAAEERAAAERYAGELRAAEEARVLATRAAAEEAARARAASASGVLQRWWRRRSGRMRSMVAAVRREQEQLRKMKRSSWGQADDFLVMASTSTGASSVVSAEIDATSAEDYLSSTRSPHWPSSGPTAIAERLAQRVEQAAERLCRAAAEQSNRNMRKRSKSREDQPREPSTQTSRSKRPLKEVKHKKQDRKTAHDKLLPRTSSDPQMGHRRSASHNGRGVGGCSRLPPPSPRSLRRVYRQEIARLLAQHVQLRRRLPPELHGLPAQLMEAANALGHNGPPVPLEVLAHIDEVLHTLKAALKDQAGLSPYQHMPDSYYPTQEFVYYSTPEVPQRLNEVAPRSYHGGGHFFGADRLSAPALLQSWGPSYVNTAHSGSVAFFASPAEEQQCTLRHSVSARSSLRGMSPIRGSRSPVRTLPATARTAAQGFHTPIRSSTVLSAHVSTPGTGCTPRQTRGIMHSDAAATPTAPVPLWAWPAGGASVTAQAAPAATRSQIASISMACASPAPRGCRIPSPPPQEKDRDIVHTRMMALPTPMRSTCMAASPCHKVRVPVVHATPVGSATVPSISGSVHVPVSAQVSGPVGSARIPATGSMHMPASGLSQGPAAAMSPTKSPVGTPGVPSMSSSSSAFMCTVTSTYKQAVQRERTASSTPCTTAEHNLPNWRSMLPPMVRSASPVRPCNSFQRLHA